MKKNETKNGKKKNVMMRVASALGILVLLTTCVISGTFAKYTNESNYSTSARVAKWGFEADSTLAIDDLFTYTDANVASSNSDKIIAPGTTQTIEFIFEYDGASNGIKKPEVAYKFEVLTTGSDCSADIKANPNIKWYLDDVLAPESGDKAAGTWDALILAIEALDGNKTNNEYAAGTLPDAFYGTGETPDSSHTVGWKWFFDETESGAPGNNDTGDTTMGNADTLGKVTLNIKIRAEQIN